MINLDLRSYKLQNILINLNTLEIVFKKKKINNNFLFKYLCLSEQ